jgi:hypothetical protein
MHAARQERVEPPVSVGGDGCVIFVPVPATLTKNRVVMRSRSAVLLLIPLLASVNIRSAEAQAVLDRIVGPTEFGDPVFLRGVDGQQLAILGRAAGVAIGFEGIVPVRYRSSIRATARPLRTVLDTLVHADPRYEWREDDGVIVVRPVAAWSDDSSALHAPIDALMLEDVTARDVLNLLAQMVGAQAPDIGHDTRRFSRPGTPGRDMA